MSTLELESIAWNDCANGKRWIPQMHALERKQLFQNWMNAVPKIMGWIEQDVET
jgi:hypothetical protein